MRILKEANKANITYELAREEGELKGKDKEKLFKLLKKIGNDKSINKEISRSDCNTRKFLLATITDTHGGRIERFTLLHYAKFCKNEQATRDILEEAEEYKLSEKVNNEKIVSHYLGSHGKLIHTYSAVEDGVVRVKDLKDWNNKKEMNPNVITDTSDVPSDITSLKSDEDGKNSSIENVIETHIQPCKKINNGKYIDTHQSVYEANRETQGNFTNSGGKVIKEPHAFKSISFNACINGEPYNIADEESSTKTMQRRAILAGAVGVVLLVSGIVSHIMKMYTIAVVGMIAGLACISFALYSTLEPSTKLEKVEQSFQSNAKEYY